MYTLAYPSVEIEGGKEREREGDIVQCHVTMVS